MSSAPVRSGAPGRLESHLRLIGTTSANARTRLRRREPAAAQGASGSTAAQVVLAGANVETRTSVLDELSGLLPQSTRFVEAGETWEVIARAAESGMVVLAGDLGDVSAESLTRMLERRYPTLPVLAVGQRAPRDAAADVHVAGA